MDTMFDGMIQSAQIVAEELTELFDDTEQGLEDTESEDEDNA